MSDSGSKYLPDLSKCLAGNELLVSWEEVYHTLDSPERSSPPLTAFLSDIQVKKHLSSPFPSFAKPSREARTAFDSRTAAISITPSPSNGIDKIKESALWLSKEVEIDELEALRLTLLEWQYQPEARLKAGFSDAELASLRDLYSPEYCEAAGLVPDSPLNRSEKAFESEDGQRARLLQTYLRENVFLLAVSNSFSSPLSQTSKGKNVIAPPRPTITDLVTHACQAISTNITALQSPKPWAVTEEFLTQIQDASATSNLQSIALAIELLLLHSTEPEELISAQALLQWLHLMQSVDHFGSFQSDIPVQQAAIEHIRSVSACVTLSFLQPTAILLHLVDHPEQRQGGYIHEFDYIAEIQECFVSFAVKSSVPATPAILAWALLLLEIKNLATYLKDASENRAMQKALNSPQDTRRSSMSSTSSGHQTFFEDILGQLNPGPNNEDPAEQLLHHVIHSLDVLDYICQLTSKQTESSRLSHPALKLLQDLVKQALPTLGYSPDLLSAQLAILNSIKGVNKPKSDYIPSAGFIEDRFLMESVFDVSAARFPYEASPFLRLCKSLASANVFDEDGSQYIAFRLHQLETFTQLATQGFSYRTIREDENANLVSLNNAVNVFDLQEHRLLGDGTQPSLSIILADTVGEVISNSMPPTIKWQHSFSGLELLGKWIELHREGSLVNCISGFEDPDDVAAEAILTITALLENTHAHARSTGGSKDALRVCNGLLEEASSSLQRELSLVGCIFDITEHQLQAPRGQAPSISSRDLLAACVDFLTVYTELYPTQVWPLVMRSSIFGGNGAKRNAISVVGSVELPLQSFRLLESCSRLFQIIIKIAVSMSLQAEDSAQAANKKGRLTASQRLNAATISSCADTMLSALEGLSAWAFRDPLQKQRIFASITSGFYDIIYHAFGRGESVPTTTTIKTTFVAGAQILVQGLQNPGLQTTGAGPLFQQMLDVVADSKLVDSMGTSLLETGPTLELAQLVLRHSLVSEGATTDFAKRLLDLLPVLVRLPSNQISQWKSSITLIDTVLRSIPPESNSSILGHLGAATCISWVDSLWHITTHYPADMALIWQTYSRLVTLDQQWLAIVLVTGSPPGRQSKACDTPKLHAQSKPKLQRALDLLSTPNKIPSEALLTLMEFVLEAQRNWPTVSDSISAQAGLFPGLINWICNHQPNGKDTSRALHNKVAAAVLELSILHIHRLMLKRNEKEFTMFIPLLMWLSRNAISVSIYNASLHTNLKKNFAMKYPSIDPTTFRRSGLTESKYGPDYYYDLELAGTLIGEDPFWKSDSTQTFHAEFQRANINLSIVDSELILLRGLEYLCVEHAAFFSRNYDVARIMAQMVTNCLSANSQPVPAEKLFDTVFQTRADLAMTLLRPLVALKPQSSEYSNLLKSAWTAVCFRDGNYETAILNDDLTYWRPCLNALLMTLQFHVNKKPKQVEVGTAGAIEKLDPFNDLFCEVARDLIGFGLKPVVTSLQSRHTDRNPAKEETNPTVNDKDVSLLLNILQSILRIPTLPQFSQQLSASLITSGAAQSLISLYNWSHLLTSSANNEPIYADLAIRGIASLSSLTPIAEEMAVEGIFTRLLSAKFTQRLQTIPGGISHLDKRPHGALFYGVWAQGIIPICLNLLYGVGGGVAGEVSDFLNRFSNQLGKASMSLSGAPSEEGGGGGILTLSLVTELATLSLISHILATFRDAGASAGVDSEAISALSSFDERKANLVDDVRDAINQDVLDRRRRTVATDDKEVAWSKTVLSKDGKIKDKKDVRERDLTVLDHKILAQLRQIRTCLAGDGGEEDKG